MPNSELLRQNLPTGPEICIKHVRRIRCGALQTSLPKAKDEIMEDFVSTARLYSDGVNVTWIHRQTVDVSSELRTRDEAKVGSGR